MNNKKGSKNMKKMPKPIDYGKHSSSLIGAIMMNDKDHDPDFDNREGLRTVMGYNLPSWQRGEVWSDEQKVKFIESAWMGLGLGTYTVNVPPFDEDVPHRLDNLLIDGQQRISAIRDYLNDELVVFGARWSEVDIPDQRRFKQTKFACYQTESTDEAYLRNYYDLMNFGGTAHRPEEAASFDAEKLADEIIDGVKSVVREQGPDGDYYYDARMAEPDVNSPGPEIGHVPDWATSKEHRAVVSQIYKNMVYDAMRKIPALEGITPEPEYPFPAWIKPEPDRTVRIIGGKGSDGMKYLVNAKEEIVHKVNELGQIEESYDLHSVDPEENDHHLGFSFGKEP